MVWNLHSLQHKWILFLLTTSELIFQKFKKMTFNFTLTFNFFHIRMRSDCSKFFFHYSFDFLFVRFIYIHLYSFFEVYFNLGATTSASKMFICNFSCKMLLSNIYCFFCRIYMERYFWHFRRHFVLFLLVLWLWEFLHILDIRSTV